MNDTNPIDAQTTLKGNKPIIRVSTMNYIEMTKECELCRMLNDDVSCEDCKAFGRCISEDDKDEDRK